MKIAIFIDKMGNGGAERVSAVLANYFADHGHKTYVVVVTLQNNDYALRDSVSLVTLPAPRNKIARIFARFGFIRRFLKSEEIDVAISMSTTFGMYIALNKRRSKTLLVSSERNDPVATPKGKLHRALRWLIFKLSDRIVFQTPGARDFFSSSIRKKGVVIPNPIKEDLPAPYVGERRKEIVMFSRLEPQKNLPMALEAFKIFKRRFPDYKLNIYGRGSLEESLKARVASDAELRDGAIFSGFASDVHERIKDAAIYASTSDFEGISNSMLEALALGIPTVCTDCPPGGARMFIEPRVNGMLAPVGDAESFAAAMIEVASNADLRATLESNAPKIRERLATGKICSSWLEALQ